MRLHSLLLLLILPVPVLGQEQTDLFEKSIKPILSQCTACHNGERMRGGLNLSTRESALKGGESGSALVPNDAKKSLLYQRVSAGEMPPKKPLSAKQIASLKQWLDSGAKWEGRVTPTVTVVEENRAGPDWWSLQPIQHPPLPQVRNRNWPRNPIDHFVLAKLEAKGLMPSSDADRLSLLRRVKLDLLGLPPMIEEIERFLQDSRPDAWERLVEQWLDSPQYGERWARHWLDVARFGESHGFERDQIRPHAWRYRDYVIEAFNSDKPYDQFVREQIAGDVMRSTGPEGVVATGFLVAGPWDEVGSSQQSLVMRERVREEQLEEMISGVAQSFLGLTVNCARCHDHKFDPIPQLDYYRFKAALEGVRHGNRSLISPEKERQRREVLAQLDGKIAELRNSIAKLEQIGREKLLPKEKQPSGSLPAPRARWAFEGNANDAQGILHGELLGGARIQNGRLILNGTDAYVRTASLKAPVREKTLEAWVALPTLDQGGGGVITIETGNGTVFDSIVFAERQAKQWMAGSNSFQRTKDLNGPMETAKPTELVHMAIVYGRDNSIRLYRNGEPYGESYTPGAKLVTYAAKDGHILFGLRHLKGGRGFLRGEIEEARLYDHALSPSEVRASFEGGVDAIPLTQVLAALTREQRESRLVLLDKIADLRRQQAPLQSNGGVKQLVHAAVVNQPAPTHLLHRGDVLQKKEIVRPSALSALKMLEGDLGLKPDAPEGERRIRLASWITDAKNPLAARVLANRIWQYHFGHGLAGKPNDFGYNGGEPSHPQLLDWLAHDFLEHGQSIKRLHRLILTSRTYQQSSTHRAEASEIDADNRLLWRFSPRRLQGEEIRDAMLSLSGRLNGTMGGPSFQPFTVKVFNAHFYILHDRDEPEFNRRTVYRINVCSAKSPLLETFDCPDPGVKAPQRSITTTPLQALQLMNSTFVQNQARLTAERILQQTGEDVPKQVTTACRMMLGRAPNEQEMRMATRLVREHGLKSYFRVLLNSNEFLHVR